mmetsp:Transcript_2094/g.6157  ORF Transcript_2094/g.6157 Transcript_2094/m.6157 type:complete len:1145 (-) Transcript_2094:23-3457(-)
MHDDGLRRVARHRVLDHLAERRREEALVHVLDRGVHVALVSRDAALVVACGVACGVAPLRPHLRRGDCRHAPWPLRLRGLLPASRPPAGGDYAHGLGHRPPLALAHDARAEAGDGVLLAHAGALLGHDGAAPRAGGGRHVHGAAGDAGALLEGLADSIGDGGAALQQGGPDDEELVLPPAAEGRVQDGHVEVVQHHDELRLVPRERVVQLAEHLRAAALADHGLDAGGLRLRQQRARRRHADDHGDLRGEGRDLGGLQQRPQGRHGRVAAHDDDARARDGAPVLQRGEHPGERHRDAQLRQHQPAALGAADAHLLLALGAPRQLADDAGLLVQALHKLHGRRDVVLPDDEHHADAAVEGGDHLVAGDLELPGDPAEHRGQLPLVRPELRLELLRQRPRDAPEEAAAGDRRGALELPRLRERQHGVRVDARGRQEHLAEGARGVEGRDAAVLYPAGLGERAQQAEAVAVQPAGGQADEDVARLHLAEVGEGLRLLHDAHDEARDVDAARGEDAWHLRSLGAEHGAARLHAAVREALIDVQGLLRIELGRGEVAHHEDGLGAARGNVVHEESHEVHAHGGELVHGHGDLQLGAHAAGAAHEHWVLETLDRGEVAEAREARGPAVLVEALAAGAVGALQQRRDADHDRVLHGDVHAGAQVRGAGARAMPSHAVRRVLRRGDIGAEEGALEGDRPRGDVGALARLRQAVAHGRDRQHAAAVRDDLGVADALAPAAADEAVQGDHVVRLLVLLRAALGHALGLRARVVDGDAGHAARVPEAGDLVPHLVLAGVAAAGHDDRDAAGLGQHPHGVLLQPPLHAALEHAVEVALQQRHDRLRLRVSEAAIELDDLRAVCREHQPGEEAAPELRLLTLHPLDGRHEDLPLDALEHRGVDGGRRREGAHAAGVRALVVVEGPLVVLRRRQGHVALAIAAREDRALDPGHELLQDDLLAGLAHGPVQHELPDGLLGLFAVLRHDDALASGEPAGLDHHQERRLVHVLQRCLDALGALEALVLGGRDLVARQEVLAVDLGRLHLGRCLGGSEDRDARGREGIGDALAERYLRPDDHEVNGLLLAEVDHLGEVRALEGNRGGEEGRRHAAVPGGDMDLGDAGTLAQPPGHSMLAAPRPHHEHDLPAHREPQKREAGP